LFYPDGGPDSSQTRLRPFFELRSTSQVLAPGFGYYRRENRTSVEGFPLLDLVSEDYAGYLMWRPAGLPFSEFQFIRTNSYDEGREFLDTTKDFGSIISRYDFRNLNVYYLGSILDSTDRANGIDSHQVSNAVRLGYSQFFLDKRLLWNTMYNLGHLSLTTESNGSGGEVAVPVVTVGGLSAVSDTPITTRLTTNPGLIDGNLAASAGINLGLPPVGADARARNLGLDFLSPTEVNRLLVWVDRELPVEIARTFTWEVYSSPDNVLWRRESNVGLAPFGPFENRFQLDFPSITARYLKVVTRPLSGAVPDAARYPDIFVTEMQAFLRRPAGGFRDEITRTNQDLSTDVRYRILDSPAFYYEGSYWFNDGGDTGDRHQLSNGVSVNSQLGRAWSAFGRAALETGSLPEGNRVATVTNGTLTYNPISTFNASILYTGQNEWIDGEEDSRRGTSIQTNSQLYRGVDLQVGFGWNFVTRDNGEGLRDRFLTVTAALEPRPNLTLTVTYDNTVTERTGTPIGDLAYRAERVFATLAWDPFPTLHLAVAEEWVVNDLERSRAFTNIGASWSPFPDGTVQFFLTYNESLRPLEYGTERDSRQGVRWRFSGRSYLDVSYETVRTESVLQLTESKIVSANLRLSF
jgi:hypothetical protein